MTNDLETMIRSSLRDRAEDVEPTPELWTRVDRRIQRRRLVPALAWGAGLTVAAVTAALVLPGVLDGDRSVVIEPLGGNSAPAGARDAGALAGLVPNLYLAADGAALVMRALDGSQAERRLHVADGDIVAIEVRPGSTPDRVQALITVELGDRHELQLVTMGNGPVKVQPFAGVTAVADETPQAIWSPDGSRVAWAGPSGGSEADLWVAEVERDILGAPWIAAISSNGMSTADAVAQDWDVVDGREQLIVVAGGRAYAADLDAGATSPSGWERFFPGDIILPDQGAAAPVLPDTLIDVVASPTGTWALLRVDEEIRLQLWGADGHEVSAVSWAWDPQQRVQLTGAGDAVLLAAGQQSMLETSPVEVDGGPWPWSGTHTSVSSFDITATSAAAFLPVVVDAIRNAPDELENRVMQPAGRGDQEAEAATVRGPSDGAVAPIDGVPGYYLAVVDADDLTDEVRLRSFDGVVDRIVTASSFPDDQGALVGLAVAPDATEDDLRFVTVVRNGGGLSLSYEHVVDPERPQPPTVQLDLNGQMGADPGRPDVVWSPNGRYVGWLTEGGDTFRVVDVASWVEAIDANGGDRRIEAGRGFGPGNVTIDVALERPMTRLGDWLTAPGQDGATELVGVSATGQVRVVVDDWRVAATTFAGATDALAYEAGGIDAEDRPTQVVWNRDRTVTVRTQEAPPSDWSEVSWPDVILSDPDGLWLDAVGNAVVLGADGFHAVLAWGDPSPEMPVDWSSSHDLPGDVRKAVIVPRSTPWAEPWGDRQG